MSETSDVPTVKTAQLDAEAARRALSSTTSQFATLLVLENGNVKRTHILDETPTVIGRSPTATIPLASDAVASREHAQVVFDLGQSASDRLQYFLADLGSTNGTFLNGRRLPPQERCPLSDGDRFAIGSHTFVFVLPLRSGSKFLTGDLSRISVFDVIQVIEANRLTASLNVRGGQGQGWLGFNEGLIVACEVGGASGLAAFRKLVTFTEGFFDVERSATPFPVTIMATSNASLALDTLRELDEANADQA